MQVPRGGIHTHAHTHTHTHAHTHTHTHTHTPPKGADHTPVPHAVHTVIADSSLRPATTAHETKRTRCVFKS